MTQAQALDILKTGANVFLTGEPGAGKTHTINEYVAYLRAHGVEPAITASTGIAATHIHGQTIHSWSGIGIRRSLGPYDLDQLTTTEYLVKRIQNTKVLIIDEVSMIDAAILDMIDILCREMRSRDEAFGGIQVVLVGDFFQLPPVSRSGDQVHFAFESDAWRRMQPVICYLTEQHRQSDQVFLSLLSAIRKNTYSDTHHQHLERRRYDADDALDPDATLTRLFSHNTDVDTINDQELSKLDSLPTIYTMTSKGKDSLVAGLRKGCLSPEKLVLKVGATVMCTKNNAQKGYVNGTLGTVVSFESMTKYPVIETKSGERITIEPESWIVEENGKEKARITQIPLRLAWAITIHKSQGMSLDSAVMDLREVFEYGQGYVALSRVRTLEGLHLLGWNERTFEVHPRILAVDATFAQQSEAAVVMFGDIPKGERETMHRNFILASGGTVSKKVPKQKKEKVDTLEATLMLVLQGKPIKVISKERDLATTTVFGHLEKLVMQGRLAYDDIAYLITETIRKGYSEIKHAFIAADTSQLTPIREVFKDRYSYDELRIARMMMVLEGKE
jgi:ATP-dependent DNA helicase PIF1